jgi:uncharacterized protein YyaL (SSP411 family)
LLQHAFNPVDWYPWGEEALSLARKLDKPIFLSIGYSACHWCHVMEHESFENPNIAKRMNDLFVCIKVDREERPDLDQIYMTSVQMMTGRGGWPMSMFLTPMLQPFYGGTYWPPVSRMGMPGFHDILKGVADAWANRRDDVLRSAGELTEELIRSTSEPMPRSGMSLETLRGAMRELLRRIDWEEGGLGGAPKFPHPMDLRVLLRCWKRFGEKRTLDAVRLTLDKMAGGGIYDQLGGGFHRYSTDAHWLAPHFEKMLYDNALLTQAYLEAYQATGNPNDARVVRETLDYVLREMTQPGGGFYSTQDADSEGEEGKFFVWSQQEILELLGPEDGPLFCEAYDVSPHGNWEGHNILNLTNVGQVLNLPVKEGTAQDEQVENLPHDDVFARCRTKLFAARSKRIAPARDDKVLVSWNGLMIAAMSQAAVILNEPHYAEAAQAAADFILVNMRDADGRLLHAFKDGRARFNAYLDDYACLIDGLIDLYQATFDPRWLEVALELADQLLARFEDPHGGGFFYTSSDHEELVARPKDTQDNATPSGNGMAAYALARLGTLVGQPHLLGKAYATLEAMSGQLDKFALASGQSLLALDFVLGPTHEIVLADSKLNDAAEGDAALRELHQRFWPNKVVLRRPLAMSDSAVPQMLQSLFTGKEPAATELKVFVCEKGACQTPFTNLSAWRSYLGERQELTSPT